MQGKRIVVGAAIALVAMTRVVAGDPISPTPPINLYIKSPSTVHTDGGTDLRLPPGYFLDEDTHSKLDTEMKRLQDQETRLGAENKYLKKTLNSWQPGWIVVIGALVGGVALGWYVNSKL